MRRVIIESPYAGQVVTNTRYVRACLRDSLLRNEAPFASHAIYTLPGVLRDEIPEERELGMEAGLQWAPASCDRDLGITMYTDRGVSSGMQYGIERHRLWGRTIEERQLGEAWTVIAKEIQALDFAYANLAATKNHRPYRAAFRRIALAHGGSEADFDDWARGREWEEHRDQEK